MSLDKNILVIENGVSSKAYWGDIWRHRELLLFLAWRDILVRYKQTVIGVSWVLFRPLLTMAVLTVVFGRIANLSSGDIPYSLVVLTGLLPWFFFSNGTSESSNSLVTNANLLSKVYFPRMIVPASTILVSAVDFVVSIFVLILLMMWYGILPTWHVLLLPVLGVWVGLLALGTGLLFSALTVSYRDFRHIVPFMLMLGIYTSPVGYSTSLIPEKWAPLYYLNPIAGIVDAFRWAILGQVPSSYGIISALIITTAALVVGFSYFRSAESRFADEI
ncbi:ABC transporter permease [Thalassospira profundimaris]|uniref:ABC transporter permease n=1 Tax=Thalassospira profundimaris TaxID=502049 RepID=UPI0002872230|nr:ABC transporter permease [Thalassospira profundimaris]EKF09226.1 ABC transporter [Thalassospira profundimaris WP0211]